MRKVVSEPLSSPGFEAPPRLSGTAPPGRLRTLCWQVGLVGRSDLRSSDYKLKHSDIVGIIYALNLDCGVSRKT